MKTQNRRYTRTASFMLIACMALGCTTPPQQSGAIADDTEQTEDLIINEGVDTPIEIMGYSQYKGEFEDIFLKEGDKIAVISPASLPTRQQVDTVVEGLKEWGYVPVEGKYAFCEERTLEDCIEDLEWALTDPEIKAIFCVRGGWASCEVLAAMDRSLITNAKKPIIGYSDISAYHSGWTVAGVPSIHASMSAAFTDLSEECVTVQKHMMKGEIPSYRCEGSEYDNPGTAEGILIGGNLSVFASVMNTDYDSSKIDQPYILLLEEVEANLLYVHSHLTMLKNSGVLDRASGIILGEWTDFRLGGVDYDGGSRGGTFTSASDMIYRQFLKDYDIPIAYGFPAGHGEKNYPLLMGAKVRLSVSEDSYTLEWTDAE